LEDVEQIKIHLVAHLTDAFVTCHGANLSSFWRRQTRSADSEN